MDEPGADARPTAPTSMTIEFHTALDTGRARQNNEDSVAVDATAQLAVLADGMGGYNAGEVASQMLTSFISVELGRWLVEAGSRATDAEVRRAMDVCVENANRSILAAARTHAQYAGMGTTLVLAVFRERHLLLGHVGDSRCYRWRDGRLHRLTRDHSLLQEQLDAGLITPEQAAFSLNRNLVTRAVGVEEEVQLETHQHEIAGGDLYLLCSDGLSDMIDDVGITRLVQAGGESLHEIAHTLVTAANDAGGRDNISLVLARVSGSATAPPRSWWPFGR